MERNRYLELCKKNSLDPNSVILTYRGFKYYPLGLKVWFDGQGNTKNTAEMVGCYSRTKLYADVKDVNE